MELQCQAKRAYRFSESLRFLKVRGTSSISPNRFTNILQQQQNCGGLKHQKMEQDEIRYRLLILLISNPAQGLLGLKFQKKMPFIFPVQPNYTKKILSNGGYNCGYFDAYILSILILHSYSRCHLSNHCTLQTHPTSVKMQHSLQICASLQPIWSSVDLSDVDIYPGILDIVQDKAVIFNRQLRNQCRDFLLVAFCEDSWYTYEM